MAKAYEVVFKYETNAQKKAVANDETAKKQDRREKSFAKGAESIISYANIKGTASQFISREVNRIELRTGASEFQQRVQTVYNMATSILDTGVSIGIGVATGNLPLVALTAVTKGLNALIDVVQNQYDINLKRQFEGISIGLASQRASTNGRRQ